LLFGKEGVVGADQAGLRRLGAINAQGRPAHLALIDPWQQAGDFLLRCGNLRGRLAGHTVGFGEIAAEVPDPLAVGGRVGGDGYTRFWPTAQAVCIQRLEVWPFGQDHVQRPGLHGGLLQAQRMQQLFGAGAGAEDDALGADFAAVDAQAS